METKYQTYLSAEKQLNSFSGRRVVLSMYKEWINHHNSDFVMLLPRLCGLDKSVSCMVLAQPKPRVLCHSRFSRHCI